MFTYVPQWLNYKHRHKDKPCNTHTHTQLRLSLAVHCTECAWQAGWWKVTAGEELIIDCDSNIKGRWVLFFLFFSKNNFIWFSFTTVHTNGTLKKKKKPHLRRLDLIQFFWITKLNLATLSEGWLMTENLWFLTRQKKRKLNGNYSSKKKINKINLSGYEPFTHRHAKSPVRLTHTRANTMRTCTDTQTESELIAAELHPEGWSVD